MSPTPKYPKMKPALLMLLVVILLAACSAAPSPSYNPSGATGGTSSEAPARDEKSSYSMADSTTGQSAERLVIRNADVSLVVDDPGVAMDKITQMAETMGGYVVSANLRQMELSSGLQVPEASVTVRVPAERLNEALDKILALSSQEPVYKNISSQDVTKEYTDRQSRLVNLKNTEAQLTKIMEEANKTDDVLTVYNRLVEIREQIEVLQGEIQYYEQSAALSAIKVELTPDEAIQPLKIGKWEPAGTAKNAVQALFDTLQFLVKVVIWVVIYILPVLLVLFLIFVLPLRLLWQAYRRNRQKNRVIPESPKDD